MHTSIRHGVFAALTIVLVATQVTVVHAQSNVRSTLPSIRIGALTTCIHALSIDLFPGSPTPSQSVSSFAPVSPHSCTLYRLATFLLPGFTYFMCVFMRIHHSGQGCTGNSVLSGIPLENLSLLLFNGFSFDNNVAAIKCHT